MPHQKETLSPLPSWLHLLEQKEFVLRNYHRAFKLQAGYGRRGEALLLWSWVFLLFISSVNIQLFAYRCGVRAQVMIPSYYKQVWGHALTFQHKRSRGLGWYRVAEAVKMVPADPLCWVCGFGVWESSCSLHLFCRTTTLFTKGRLNLTYPVCSPWAWERGFA